MVVSSGGRTRYFVWVSTNVCFCTLTDCLFLVRFFSTPSAKGALCLVGIYIILASSKKNQRVERGTGVIVIKLETNPIYQSYCIDDLNWNFHEAKNPMIYKN